MPSFPISPEEYAISVLALEFQAHVVESDPGIPGASRIARELRSLASVVSSCPPSLSWAALATLCASLESLIDSGDFPDIPMAIALHARLTAALPPDIQA